MTPIGLFYGSNTDYTRIVVDQMVEEFEVVVPDLLSVYNIGETPLEELLVYDTLIIGRPTWNIGQLQDDWDDHFLELDNLDLTGKKIAIFGLSAALNS